jgi:CHAD domain-containing protein
MRVAIRWLRNAIVTFGENGSRQRLKRFGKATRRLGKRLGAVRDADVQVAALRRTLAGAAPDEAAGVEFAIEHVDARRANDLEAVGPALEAFTRLRDAVEG